MPVTFPDGTTADLLYPSRLALEDLNVYAEAFAEGPTGCGQQMDATRTDPHERWIRGTIPLWEHERPDGAAVALWNGDGGDYLVYRFGAWSVMLPCEPTVTGQALTTWADQLDGVQSPDGLLELEATAPIHVNPWHDANGPTVRLSNQGVIVDIQPGSYICKPGHDQDTDPRDGVVQWCVQEDGGIRVYGVADGANGRDFLQALVDGLEVRAVQPP